MLDNYRYAHDDDNYYPEEKEGQENGTQGGEGAERGTQTPTPPTSQTPAGAVNAGQSVSVSGTSVPKPSWREEPRNSWESYASAWNRNNPLESDEDYEKRRRRTRASAIISSLGEGLSSMANLYYTTHYSPSAAPTNLSAGMLKRYNDMEADRAKNKEAWAKGYQQAKQLDEQKNEKDRNWSLTLQQYLDNKGYKDADEKRKDENQRMTREKHDWEGQLQPSKRRMAEAQAGMAEQQLKYLPQEQADKHAQSVAATAAANRSHRGGGGSSSSGVGLPANGKYPVYHKDGTITFAATEDDWHSQIVGETDPGERDRVYIRNKEGNIYVDKKTAARLNGVHKQKGAAANKRNNRQWRYVDINGNPLYGNGGGSATREAEAEQYRHSGTTIGLGGDERGDEDNTPEFYR